MPFKAAIIGLSGLALGAFIGVWSLNGLHGSFATRPPGQVSVGAAKIGGPFELVDQTGKRRTDMDFRGRYMLVFFGFLYCPDVCPATLQVVTEAMERLGSKQERITPIFISVDPERDTPKALAAYLANFSPRLVGLTGSPEQIKGAAKVYRAFFKKVANDQLPDSYTVDHSTILYLMGPDGRYVTHFTHGTGVTAMTKRLKALL